MDFKESDPAAVPDLQAARLALANQFAKELAENYKAIDKDRNGVLSPLEIVTASEAARWVPGKVQNACRYFDLTYTGSTLNETRLEQLKRITSLEPDAKEKWMSHQSADSLKWAIAGGLVNETIIGCVAYKTRSPRIALIGTAAVGAAAGAAYALSQWRSSRNFDRTRDYIQNSSAADELLPSHLK